MTEVVVTGLGVVSSVGSGVDAFLRSMSAGDRPPARPTGALPDGRAPSALCQTIPEGSVPGAPGELAGVPLGRTSRMSEWVAEMAVTDAGIEPGGPGRLAVVLASGVSDASLVESWRAGEAEPPRLWVPSFLSAAAIAARFGARVQAASPSNACAGGLYAMAMGADLIRTGEADVVIAGAAETYSRVTSASFNRLGALDPDGVRPFHRERKGTGMGEGAAAVVLESAEHAAARGARSHGTLVGSGWSCDAYHTTAPDPDGVQIAAAMAAALAEAGAKPDDVAFAIPHATGTELSDVTEARALHAVFGERAAEIPLYSLKALIGHTGSASGAISAVAALLFLRDRCLPGNLPVADQDPECRVWLPTEPVTGLGGLALVNSFGFGGHNISLLLEGAR